jgi:hypothetical protein
VRYGFGTGKKVKFPIALTYSNRSDLIVHPALGLQFGVSYDLSAITTPTSSSSGNSVGGN